MKSFTHLLTEYLLPRSLFVKCVFDVCPQTIKPHIFLLFFFFLLIICNIWFVTELIWHASTSVFLLTACQKIVLVIMRINVLSCLETERFWVRAAYSLFFYSLPFTLYFLSLTKYGLILLPNKCIQCWPSSLQKLEGFVRRPTSFA